MVNGTATHDFQFVDSDTGQEFTLTTTFSDGIHLKLLEQIAKMLRKIANG